MEMFTYSNSGNSYLSELKKTFSLDDLIDETSSDTKNLSNLVNWVHSRWSHNGVNTPKSSDPLSILKEACDGKSFRCVEYSKVLAGVTAALGYPSKVVGLMTEDVETKEYGAGHVVAEIFLKDINKWVVADPQFDAIPVRNDVALNLVELKNLLCSRNSEIKFLSHFLDESDSDDYVNWLHPYLFYFRYTFNNSFENTGKRSGVVLCPEGSPFPTVFQKTTPIENVIYTTDFCAMYEKPNYIT